MSKTAMQELKIELRRVIADYMYSEGCSCCENREAHQEAKKQLAKLLNVRMYEDKSGYDFYKYRTQPSPNKQ